MGRAGRMRMLKRWAGTSDVGRAGEQREECCVGDTRGVEIEKAARKNMNWKRVIWFSVFFLVFPEMIGFISGITQVWWEDMLSYDGVLWARRVVIILGDLCLYTLLAVRQVDRRATHVFSVFVILEVLHTAIALSTSWMHHSLEAAGIALGTCVLGLFLGSLIHSRRLAAQRPCR